MSLVWIQSTIRIPFHSIPEPTWPKSLQLPDDSEVVGRALFIATGWGTASTGFFTMATWGLTTRVTTGPLCSPGEKLRMFLSPPCDRILWGMTMIWGWEGLTRRLGLLTLGSSMISDSREITFFLVNTSTIFLGNFSVVLFWRKFVLIWQASKLLMKLLEFCPSLPAWQDNRDGRYQSIADFFSHQLCFHDPKRNDPFSLLQTWLKCQKKFFCNNLDYVTLLERSTISTVYKVELPRRIERHTEIIHHHQSINLLVSIPSLQMKMKIKMKFLSTNISKDIISSWQLTKKDDKKHIIKKVITQVM